MSKTLKQIALNNTELNHSFAKNMVGDRVYYYMGVGLHFETLFSELGIEYKPISDFSEYTEAKEICREHLRQFKLPHLVDAEDQVKF
jgi:hypothetical protein